MIIVIFVGKAGPGADQTHFPPQDVQELRKLIKPGCTQNGPEWNQSRIPLGVHFHHWSIRLHETRQMLAVNIGVRIQFHRPEFEADEASSPVPNTLVEE